MANEKNKVRKASDLCMQWLYQLADEYGGDEKAWEQVAVDMVKAMSETQATEILEYVARMWDVELIKSTKKSISVKKGDLHRNVYEGWTPQDFIDELEPQVQMIMSGQSWQSPFQNKKELEDWCKDNQPYYKKKIPEVVNYFAEKYGISKMKKYVDDDEYDFVDIDDMIECPYCGDMRSQEVLGNLGSRAQCRCGACGMMYSFDNAEKSAKKSARKVEMCFADNVKKMRENNYAKTGNINQVKKA